MSAPVYAPFITVPPFTSCTDSYIVFGQGTPPFNIFPIATGDQTGTSLENIPLQTEAGVFKWNVDFQPGANITWVLIDGSKQTAFSQYRVVQNGAVTSCPKNTYKKSSPKLGAILGGVLGALAVVAALILLIVFRKKIIPSRYRRRSRSSSGGGGGTHGLEPKGYEEDSNDRPIPLDRRRADLARNGTFNIDRRAGVQLNPTSVDHEAMQRSPPPMYHHSRGPSAVGGAGGETNDLHSSLDGATPPPVHEIRDASAGDDRAV